MRSVRLRTRLVSAVILTLASAPANASSSLSAHMGSHIALMNFLAPLIALTVIAFAPPRVSLPDNAMVLPATVSQIFLLWVVHAPTVLIAAMSNSVLHVGLQALLFLAALWFWIAVFLQAPRRFWRAIFALLVTGKLFCLLGALLVFAPRPLYAAHGVHTISAVIDVTGVEDQQLAGLLMLVACPLSYVVAGIAITARAIRSLDTTDEFLRPAEGLVRGDQR